MQAVATAARRDVGECDAEIVRTEKPCEGAFGFRTPRRAGIDALSRDTGGDRRTGFQRLLIERLGHIPGGHQEAMRTDGPEMHPPENRRVGTEGDRACRY